MVPRRVARRIENGFTLIEVLFALFIFSIALLGLAQLQITAIRGNRSSYDMGVATSVASDSLEEMVQTYSSDPEKVVCPPVKTFIRSSLTFTRTCVLDGGETGQRTVTVTVSWRNVNGMDREVAIESLL